MKIIKNKVRQTVIQLGDSTYSGIDITINKSKKTLYISGFYDSFCGIQGEEIKLDDLINLFE